MARLSIVIPAYNVEAYITRCLDSIICQVSGDIEVLLVDDGSTDNTGGIIDKYAERYANISVIHQANAGVSAARNAGIEKANGDWIWFVDGDDYIEQPVDVTAIDANCMLAVMGCVWEEDGRCVSMPASSTDIPYNTWRCLFRHDAVTRNAVCFTTGRCYAEDQEFIIKFLLAAGCYGNIDVLSGDIYHYTVRPGSAVTSDGRKTKMVKDIFAVWCKTFCGAIRYGVIVETWMLRELKRQMKSLLITIVS